MALREELPTEVLTGAPGVAADEVAEETAQSVHSEHPPPARTDDTDLVGRTLGKFQVVEKLGRGGSGDVYRAEQQQLGRSAVIKVLRRGAGSVTTTKVDRFLREAKLASRLDHPYAAHVYAFGAEVDGELWIAMEHVKGATLDELVNRRGPIPPGIFGALFGRICEVVHTAHELGIVHRDIKGSNVMVIERAGQLLPKLLDFGIAKADDGVADDDALADGSGSSGNHLTQHGATLGSPHYMSPEQWLTPADVDAKADIYALGVLAYRCVAGVVPFRQGERAALVDAHLNAPPPPLPVDVPDAVATAIFRALEKAPEARWSTALAFGEAVQRAAGSVAPAPVPLFDPYTRDVWLRAGPQPIADAVARLAAATTAADCDAAVRELVAITCRWLAVLALATVRGTGSDGEIRERARGVVGHDDAQPWLELARAIGRANARAGDGGAARGVPGLAAALAGSDALAALAERLDDHERGRAGRNTQPLALDVAAAAEALRPVEPLLAYQLVVGRGAEAAESWVGTRRRDRERVLVWGDALADGEVALLDAAGKVVLRLSPLAQVIAPLPSAEPEMFLLWRGGRGSARLVAAPWGFEVDDDRAAARLATLTTEEGDSTLDAVDDSSPYPGLVAYREADVDRFVGREREVEALANRLVRAPLLAVLGPSGAGKSSFIHAGLVPRLEHNGYRVVTLRPGRHPMHALAALPMVSADSLDDSATALRLRELGESATRGLVIVIDQLEELVTLCSDPGERARFAATLAAAADGPSSPVRVVVTLRDDFAAVIESEPALRGRFEVFVLGTPLPEALRRIVVEPARRASVSVDPSVVDDMVAEVAGRPASLPLLSFTAAQLWRTRDKVERTITRAAYDAIGGVAGALSTYADQVYESLARRDQQVVRALFARLVAGDGTRIPAPRAELEQLPDTKPVLAHLIDARLLVVREDDRDATNLVEIVHECLAERWDRLARWRREDAADRALVADLRAAARRWLDTSRSADLLWRGEALVELRKLVERSPALTDAERAFAAASIAADRRARRVRRGAVAVVMTTLVVVAVVMAYLGVDASRSRDAAEDSAASARATAKLADDRLTASLVAQGTTQLNDGRELAALAFFAEALRRGSDSVGLREMIAVASRGWRHHVGDIPDVFAMTAVPAGFVVGGRDGHVHWIGDDGKLAPRDLDLALGEISILKVQDDHVVVIAHHGIAAIGLACCDVAVKVKHDSGGGVGYVHGALVGPGSDEVAMIEGDGVNVYGDDGTLRRNVAVPDSPFADGRFAADHRHAEVWANNRVQVVDLDTMTLHEVTHELSDDLAMSVDGRTFAFLDTEHVAHVIGMDGSPVVTIHPNLYASNIAVSPTGDRIAVLAEHSAAVYGRDGKELRRFATESIGQSIILVDGDNLWLATRDGKLRRYHAGILVASTPVHVGDVMDAQRSGPLIGTLASDNELELTRADAMDFRPVDPPCERSAWQAFDTAVLSVCKDGRFLAYRGIHRVGELVSLGDSAPWVAYEPDAGLTVVASQAITVYDGDGKQRASSKKLHAENVAFEDAAHVLVLEHGEHGGLWRWDYAADHWDRLFDAPKSEAVTATPYAIWVAYQDGHVSIYDGGREARRLDGIGRVAYFAQTRDRQQIAMQLESGATLFADTRTATIAQRLPAADSSWMPATFDDTGELVLRPTNGIIQIWDRPTGQALVYNLDLLHVSVGVVWGPHGSLELQGDRTGVLDIARDDRPPAAVIADIACRVPLAIVDGVLQPSVRRCADAR